MYEGNSTHGNSHQVGLEYQDFIIDRFLNELKLVVSLYGSTKYQYRYGENAQGIEIKYDARSTGDCTYYQNKPTGNVAIEVKEKTRASNNFFVNSGILRNDNTWLYIVGNYHQAWIFSKKHLVHVYNEKKYEAKQTLPTIMTMLIPIEKADMLCIKKLIFDAEKI